MPIESKFQQHLSLAAVNCVFGLKKPITLDDENGLGDFSQVALFWFPTQAAMTDWYESDAYHDLLSLRASAGTFTIIGVNLE